MPAPASAATAADLAAMQRALELAAAAAARGEAPIGCVVYETQTGKALGEGANRREADADPIAHAEIIALQAAARSIGDWRLNDCTLVVTLEPCPMCAGACVNARVGRVVYGAADPKAGAAASLYRLLDDPRLNHRCQVIAGVMAAEAGQVLREFFTARRG